MKTPKVAPVHEPDIPRQPTTTIGQAENGFLLLDSSFNPVAFNTEVVKILAYPEPPERIRHPKQFLADTVRSKLTVDRDGSKRLDIVRSYKSGHRRYSCRVFRLECNDQSASQSWTALLFERYSTSIEAVAELSQQFALTPREREVVELLLQGMTSKEIASRLSISPNTVKAFLRLVMVKMDVSTRSGIVGKMVQS